VRMLFSCLIDADWLDTEKACAPDKSQFREEKFPSLEELKERFDTKLEEKVRGSEKNELNTIRAEILAQCREAGRSNDGGLFTLTVPTGGGKTLSSMAFALEQAVKYGRDRIIYVIPYTSIIEQTANVFRNIFGAENVVEHHSNIDAEKTEARMELAAENWDAPIIVTTNVQFFESLYSAKPRRCRKLHNIANSVVILDEAQLITPEFLTPCVDVLNQLARNFRTSIVFCTATQPSLPKLDAATDIIPPERKRGYYRKLKRVDYQFPKNLNEKTSFEQLAEQLLSHEKVLCIVNTRSDCRKLYGWVKQEVQQGTIHLSALMCGEHRSNVIADIKERLKNKEPLRVISTQLVEAGVDIDFPVVYRALAGLDSIIQAAGRCNREGGLDGYGQVHIFVPKNPAPKGLLRKGEDAARDCLLAGSMDVDNPETFHSYFNAYYERLNDTGQAILEELKCQRDGGVYFRSVSKDFCLIKDDYTSPVIVRYKNSPEFIGQLKAGGPNKALMQRLQRFTVNVPKGHVSKLLQCGLVQRLTIFGKESDFLVQYSENCYSDDFGVDMDKLEFSAAETVL
jgi:CRISPR-associated endonuclease/helicase Cas3